MKIFITSLIKKVKWKYKNVLKKNFYNLVLPITPKNYKAKIGIGPDFKSFKFPENKSVLEDIESKYGGSSELAKLYSSHKGCLIHKWHHYINLYERYFSTFKKKKNLKFLEIGVAQGGSLQMWRKYFGDSATIFGIDINPNCYKYNGVHGEVRIGSQDDKEFLESVVDEMGGIDIVLDDGSHKIHHIKRTLDILFPHLAKEGIYFIEDLHASYWADFGGGYNSKNNFFRNIVIDLINDMHRWYHFHSLKMEHISKDCSGIHIHDSILVLEKNKTFFPQHSEQS
tara:strand:+ start:78 stop:926 length:849 start_codon:yes stop_codon:yes gene_type:complete